MKTKINTKTKIILSIVLFIVIFGGLLTVATFYDLQISQILAKPFLADGEYFSTNIFGLVWEVLGSAPVYLTITLGAVIWYWYLFRSGKKWLGLIFVAIAYIGIYLFIADTFKYIGEQMGNKQYMGKTYILIIELILSFMITVLSLIAWGRVDKRTNEKLRILGVVILFALLGQLVVHLIKAPVGRARFRTLNALNDYSYYTRWYIINGKRNLCGNLADDCCKSFPSGHTCAAGTVYSLLSLPYILKQCSNKKAKILIWTLCILYVGTVALSRIVMGAHYLSDVLVGGTIAFLASILFREIFVCKGANFKILFGKLPSDYKWNFENN